MSRKPQPARYEVPVWVGPCTVAALTFAAFLPALRDGFVSWDDAKNFVDNPHYRGLGAANLGWMWTTFHLGHYVPLSWMTLGLDYELWGMSPAGYHLTSILIHCANAVLLYVLARRLLPVSALFAVVAALLFAVHPLRVESVVWITERRDVLSLFFCLASLLAYLSSLEETPRSKRGYWISVALFAAALLSKATAMTMPAVLLILNVYPLARLNPSNWRDASARRIYTGIIPFAVLSAATVVLSIVALKPKHQLDLIAKIAVSAYGLCFYLWKTLVPANLSPLYELPLHVDPLRPEFVVSVLGVIALAVTMWLCRKRWPGITTALLLFVVITLPMLGVVQNGPQIAADRYTYFGGPALAFLAAAALAHMAARYPASSRVIAIGALTALAALTWNQSMIWHDSEGLWHRALEIDASSPMAHSAYANVMYKQDRVQEGMSHSLRSVELAPDYFEAHDDVGFGLVRLGKPAEAIEQYQRAIELNPQDDDAQSDMGVALAQQGNIPAAIDHYRQALAINPDNADAHVNWGNALVRQKMFDDAIAHYAAALAIRPDDSDAHRNWGAALAQQGQFLEAIGHLRAAVGINPRDDDAKRYLEAASRMAR